jgi:hypothetical protein
MNYRPGTLALIVIKIRENKTNYKKWRKMYRKSKPKIKGIRRKLNDLIKRQNRARTETMIQSLERRVLTVRGVYYMFRMFRKKCFQKMTEHKLKIRRLRRDRDSMRVFF